MNCLFCFFVNSHLEYVPQLRADGTPMTGRKLNRYAAFVKDQYSQVKDVSPWRTHKQVMERINQLYRADKPVMASLDGVAGSPFS